MNETQRAEEDEADLLSAADVAISRAFGELRRTVQKNLAVVTIAFLRVLGSARSGYGHISLGTLFRVLPTEGKPHAREKRLRRFLENRRLDPRGVTDGLVRLVLGRRGKGLWPICFDQTKAGATQALVAGVPFEGRALPLSVYTFEYPWKERAVDSQNQIEEVFLLDLESALPQGVRPVFVGDRGYARASLLKVSQREGRLYIIRGRAGTQVEYQGRRCKCGELPVHSGRVVRYAGVRYQARQQVLVDVIVFHDPLFKEPWRLLVPAGQENLLPTEMVVALYRDRMQIEHSFRDFKTHLGLRGLKLKVRVSERMGRLLLAFTIAYCLALVLGISQEAQQARADLEIPRRTPRHGTCRVLSVLSLAMQMLAHPRWRRRANLRLASIAARIASGRPVSPHPPPDLSKHLRSAA